MEWFEFFKEITPTAIPSGLVIFLIIKFNKLEHQLKDIRLWVQEKYVNKERCFRCRGYIDERIDLKKGA